MKRFLILTFVALSFPALAQADNAGTLASGWAYGSDGTGDATRRYASIAGEIEGAGPVTLVFSISPLAGRQARLEGLPDAPDCVPGCRPEFSFDGAAPEIVRATKSESDEGTLSFRGARDIWRSVADAERLEIVYPGEDGSQYRAYFAVAGLDLAALE